MQPSLYEMPLPLPARLPHDVEAMLSYEWVHTADSRRLRRTAELSAADAGITLDGATLADDLA